MAPYNGIDAPYRVIYDNIYGFIGLTELESTLIDLPHFQRLRHISQLGTVNYVFPSAEHTRFSHSIGVLHMMDRILIQAAREHLTIADIEKLRLAALLHDIGHYPYSHEIEQVYKKHLKHDVFEKGVLIKNGKEVFDGHHERLGEYIIQNVPKIRDTINDYFAEVHAVEKVENQNVSDEIGQIINGAHKNVLFNQLMHSELDADRLDYLLRDSEFTGASYGLFDIDQLLRHIIIQRTPEGLLFAINKKGSQAVTNYILSRYFMMSLILSNKAIASFEIMMQSIFELLIDEHMYDDMELYSYENILKTSITNDFIKFTDEYVYNRILDHQSCDNERLSDLCTRLIERRNLKEVYYTSNLKEYKDPHKPCFCKIQDHHCGQPDPTETKLMNTLKISEDLSVFYKTNQISVIKDAEYAYETKDLEYWELKENIKIYNAETNSIEYLFQDKDSLINRLGKLEFHVCRIFSTEDNKDRVKQKIEEILR